jgi:hypothetical protein
MFLQLYIPPVLNLDHSQLAINLQFGCHLHSGHCQKLSRLIGHQTRRTIRAVPEHVVARRPTNCFMPCASISIKIQGTYSQEVANIMLDLS